MLQESDIQIRGFKVRLPLDIQFVFTANPEDYTNRGAIVTPLKDRIDSQIITHYPRTREISLSITSQESNPAQEQTESVRINKLIKEMIEQIAFEARESEYIDEKSGVSARLTISAYENLISYAERRRIINKERSTTARISDIAGIIPAITGKIELVYEGEQEGPAKVAQILINKSIKKIFTQYFPDPELLKKKQSLNPYQETVNWFSSGNFIDLFNNSSDKDYKKLLLSIPGLRKIIDKYQPDSDENTALLFMEFVLHGLAEFSMLSKFKIESGYQFKDMLSSMFNVQPDDDDNEDTQDDSKFYI